MDGFVCDTVVNLPDKKSPTKGRPRATQAPKEPKVPKKAASPIKKEPKAPREPKPPKTPEDLKLLIIKKIKALRNKMAKLASEGEICDLSADYLAQIAKIRATIDENYAKLAEIQKRIDVDDEDEEEDEEQPSTSKATFNEKAEKREILKRQNFYILTSRPIRVPESALLDKIREFFVDIDT